MVDEMNLSFILPAYNEEDHIKKVLKGKILLPEVWTSIMKRL